MVRLDCVRAANAALVQSQPLVAAFSGGLSGLGEYTLRALARRHGKTGRGLRIYLVGRKQDAARRIISECQTECPTGDFRFVKAADLRLLKDVDDACGQIVEMERKAPLDGGPARVDLLVMSQGVVRFGEPEYTDEGLEVSMSLLYYSRMRFLLNLIPLLEASPLPAHVVSIYAGGKERGGKLSIDDLSLQKRSNYSFMNTRVHVVHMKTMFFEHLAKQHPGRLSLSHVFPSLVITKAFGDPSLPWWLKVTLFFLLPLATRFFSVSPEEIGDRMLFLATPRYPARYSTNTGSNITQNSHVAMSTDDVRGGGAYSLNYDGETNDVSSSYEALRKKDFESQVWEHTMKVFSEIDAGKPFRG